MLCKITRFGNGTPDKSQVVHFPKSEQELNALLCDMQINRENEYAYSISNIKTGNTALDQQLESQCRPNMDELNHIAGFIQKISDKQLEELNLIMKVQKPENSTDFINAMHNHSNFNIYENANNMKELGEEVAFINDGIDSESPLGMCINYEEYGESFHDAHEGTFINGQYVVPPMVLNEAYDGLSLPWNGAQKLLAVYVTTYEKIQECGDETPSGIWLELPATQYAIDRTAHRLGADEISDCYMYNAESPEGILLDFRLFEANASLYEVNALAEVLSSYPNPAVMEKFEAVLEYEGNQVQTLPDIINTACNLDCYNYDPEITSAEDFIINHYDNDPAKLARADDLDGEKLLARCGGKITEYGFVARNDTPMEQVYEPPEPEQEQGMQMGGMQCQ